MEHDNRTEVQEAINLDEIRDLLTDAQPPAEAAPKAEKKKEKQPGEELHGLVHDLVWIIAAVTVVFVFFVRLVAVDGESMLPTLHNADLVLLESNVLYDADELTYGDIVVLNVPYYADKGLIVKRVIATEGQEVNIDFAEGVVYVDGVRLQEDFTNTPTNINWPESYGLDYPVTVPEGCIFVLGDNRNDSTDSRYAPVGMIDTRCVLGKVWAIILPGQTRDLSGRVIDPRDWSRIGLVS